MKTIKVLFLFIAFFNLHIASAQTQATAPPPVVKLSDFEFTSINESAPIRLADLGGKIIVVCLWASWCPPCREAVDSLGGLSKEYTERGVEIIGLSVEDPATSREAVEKFVRTKAIDYKTGWVDKNSAKKLMAGAETIPQIIIFTRHGVELKRFNGFNPARTDERMRRVIDDELAKDPNE